MKEPLRYFRLLERNLPRIQADSGLQQLSVVAASGSADGFKAVLEALQKQAGEIYEFDGTTMIMDVKLDRDGLESLRDMTR